MASRPDDQAQMILLAGLLLVMSYLIFSTQTALLATVGQEAGREATNPVASDFLALRSGFAELLENELTDSAGVVQCPDSLTNWQGRVETMMTMLTQLQSNRGHSFHGTIVTAPTLVGGTLTTTVEFYLTDGDASIVDEIRFITSCV